MRSLRIGNIGQLVSMAGPHRIRTGAELADIGLRTGVDLLIEGGRVSRIVTADASADCELDAEGGVVVPGFVDAHTHACFAGSRIGEWAMRVEGQTYEQIAAHGGGILSTVASTLAADEQELSDRTIEHLRWMLRNGTTAAEVKTGYGLSFELEAKMIGAIERAEQATGMRLRKTFLGAHAIPPGLTEHEQVDACVQMASSFRDKLDFLDMFVEQGYFSPASCRRYAATARDLGLPLRLHADQLRDSDGALLAAEVGAVSADHLEHTSEAGIHVLARAGVTAGLLPGSVFGLGKSRYANGRAMIDAGVGVYLATDFNPGSSPVCSLPFCMRLAVEHMGMSVEEAFTASTYNPACSLGLASGIGSIEPGKRADLCIYPVRDYREIAYYVGVQPSEVILEGRPALH